MGWFVIDAISFQNGILSTLDLRFEQHCEGSTAALRGQIHWTSGDSSAGVGPVTPPPVGLWSAPAASTPANGNYIFLQSDAGDYVGAGQKYTYTNTNAVITPAVNVNSFSVRIQGDKSWSGDFQAMQSISQLKPGYYSGLKRYPFHNPAKGGLSWSGDGRGCNTLKGWLLSTA